MPLAPAPTLTAGEVSISSPRIITTSLAPAMIVTPFRESFAPDEVTVACTPEGTVMATAAVIVKGSYAPLVSVITSPLGSVNVRARVNVRQGAANEQAAASLPTAETNVRGAAPTTPAAKGAQNRNNGGFLVC